jgi:hypothetical protein
VSHPAAATDALRWRLPVHLWGLMGVSNGVGAHCSVGGHLVYHVESTVQVLALAGKVIRIDAKTAESSGSHKILNGVVG